jgi:hypothetical protein
MPETYGLPEPEPTRTEEVQQVFNEAIAGQGIVRRVVLYALVAFGLFLTATPAIWLGGAIAFPCLVLLMATDRSL